MSSTKGERGGAGGCRGGAGKKRDIRMERDKKASGKTAEDFM